VFDLKEADVQLNVPFAGGYIIRSHGLPREDYQPRVPWIQIELNRALYLALPHFDRETLAMDKAYLMRLNEKFGDVMACFAEAVLR
jgi:N-formylglutamate amidohydrolase